jgi:tetratricopeptide (TPR) repeat protein
MRKLAVWFFAIFCFANISSLAEDFKKPTRTAAEATPEQKALLKEGIELHDKGDYEGAIKKYESILSINPDNVSAIYEMGFSYFAKQDYKKALEINENGVEYTSNILSQFYMQIASCLDHLGNWEKAIELYNKVIKEFPQEGLVHFNLALTNSQHQ